MSKPKLDEGKSRRRQMVNGKGEELDARALRSLYRSAVGQEHPPLSARRARRVLLTAAIRTLGAKHVVPSSIASSFASNEKVRTRKCGMEAS